MLQFRRTLYAVSSEENSRQNPVSAKDYVESLHQNSRATLLYGKNNVLVLPVSLYEVISLRVDVMLTSFFFSLYEERHERTNAWLLISASNADIFNYKMDT